MQVAMIKVHNRLVDRLREDGVPEADLFNVCQKLPNSNATYLPRNGSLDPTHFGHRELVVRFDSRRPKAMFSCF
jgi:hypothetical protein